MFHFAFSVESAPRRIRSASNPLRVESAPRRIRSAELLKLRAHSGVAAFGMLCGTLLFTGTAPRAGAQFGMGGGWVLDHYDTVGANLLLGAPYIHTGVMGSDSQDVSGKLQAVYRWQPSFFNPLQSPPEYVSFRITAHASAFATAYGLATPAPPNLPAHETQEIVRANAWGKDAQVVIDANKSSADALKTALVVAKVSGNLVKSPWIECTGHAELLSGRGSISGLTQVALDATISLPGQRNVIITSALDDSYHKSDDGSLPDAEYRDGMKLFSGHYAVRNKREDDGSMDVDTVGEINASGLTYSSINLLTAVSVGSWSSLTKYYTWSGNATQQLGALDTALTGDFEVLPSDLPKDYNAQATLQELGNGTASESNFYKVRLHALLDNPVRYASDINVFDDTPAISDVHPNPLRDNGTTFFKYTTPGAEWEEFGTISLQTSFTLAGTILPAITRAPMQKLLYQILVKAITMGDDKLSDGKVEASADFEDCWLADGSTFDDGHIPTANDTPLMKAAYQMTPGMKIGRTLSFVEGEAYDKKGYRGQGRVAFTYGNGNAYAIGHYEKVGGTIPLTPSPTP